MPRILLVEDKDSLRQMLATALAEENYEVVQAKDGPDAERALHKTRFDVVLTDLRLPTGNGIRLLQSVKEIEPSTQVVIMTAFGTIEEAVKAVKEGAFDFLTKPLDVDHLMVVLRRSLELNQIVTENILLKEEFSSKLGAPRIIGRSPAFLDAIAKARKVGASDTTVLLLGESGTGKEIFARAIHHLSPRAKAPFVAINCAAIPDTLLENELFGHERGAYTGAGERRIGKFELADNGTIFLDEIGDLSQSLQAKLLRVLQERCFERVGGTRTIEVDIRVIAASNQDLDAAVKDKTFREDLFYRLSVFPIRIPSLRERAEDIPALGEHFAQIFAREMGKPRLRLGDEATAVMMNYAWPGNVRELQNCIERAVILSEGETILPEHLGILDREPDESHPVAQLPIHGTLEDVRSRIVALVERHVIKQTLERCDGNRQAAADELDISYKTLLKKVRDYDLAN